MLFLKEAPFDKRDVHLVGIAGSCVDCPKRTGHNKLLFSDLGKQDACTDPNCYQAKVSAHVGKQIAAKPQLVQISTAYGKPPEGSKVPPRNQYTAIRDEKPKTKEEAKRPEFKVCKYAAEAIITEGSDVGTVHNVCVNLACPVHHPKASNNREETNWKVEQEKQRKQQAIANSTALRVLKAIGDAVPVRLLKRDLLFVLTQTFALVSEGQLQALARQHGIRKDRETDMIEKLFAAFLRRVDEGVLSRLLVEVSILIAARRSSNGTSPLQDAAVAYKIDTDAIALKVKQEFAAKEKAKKEVKTVSSGGGKSRKAA